jgi:acyl dehydratase
MSVERALAELEPKIGSETYVGPWFTIEQDAVTQFGNLTGDEQWIHVDPERAGRESPYGGTIAHGFYLLSSTPRYTGYQDPQVPELPGVTLSLNYGLNKVRFPSAARVGARVRARSTLLSAERARGGLMVTERISVEVEGQEKPCCVAETLLLYFFD